MGTTKIPDKSSIFSEVGNTGRFPRSPQPRDFYVAVQQASTYQWPYARDRHTPGSLRQPVIGWKTCQKHRSSNGSSDP
jgi:hypothetical protein